MQKNSIKNIIPSKGKEFMNIGVAIINFAYLKESLIYFEPSD